MTGGAEVSALIGEGKEVFMITLAAFYPGKTVMQYSTIKVPVYYLFYVGS
jgi:hypothetical protein